MCYEIEFEIQTNYKYIKLWTAGGLHLFWHVWIIKIKKMESKMVRNTWENGGQTWFAMYFSRSTIIVKLTFDFCSQTSYTTFSSYLRLWFSYKLTQQFCSKRNVHNSDAWLQQFDWTKRCHDHLTNIFWNWLTNNKSYREIVMNIRATGTLLYDFKRDAL